MSIGARQAWRLVDIADHLGQIELLGRVGDDRTAVQHGTMGALLPPDYWLGVLTERRLGGPHRASTGGRFRVAPG